METNWDNPPSLGGLCLRTEPVRGVQTLSLPSGPVRRPVWWTGSGTNDRDTGLERNEGRHHRRETVYFHYLVGEVSPEVIEFGTPEVPHPTLRFV